MIIDKVSLEIENGLRQFINKLPAYIIFYFSFTTTTPLSLSRNKTETFINEGILVMSLAQKCGSRGCIALHNLYYRIYAEY